MMGNKVSVIVPVYNGERYLEECLQSILNQCYKSIEIIVIDDGSVDASGMIADCFQTRDSRVHVLHQKNQGVSAARNAGLKIATGDYITFVDADDYLAEDHIEILVDFLDGRDISITGIWDVRGEEKRARTWQKDRILNRADLFEQTVCGNVVGGYLMNKMFRRNLVEAAGLQFAEDLTISEDMFWICQYLKSCKEGAYSCKPTYYYRRNDMSAVRKMYSDHKFDKKKLSTLDAADRMWKLAEGENRQIREAFSYRLVRSRLWIMMNMVFCGYWNYKLSQRLKSVSREQFQAYLKNPAGEWYEKKIAWLMYRNPRFLYCIARMLGRPFLRIFREKFLN